MRTFIQLCLAVAAVGNPLTDLNDQLTAESEADEKAADNAKCWCKDAKELVDTRLRNSESEISQLERIRDSRFYENQGLKVEIKQHHEQIASHTRSLGESTAIADKASDAHSSEKEETEQALESLRKALDKVPKGNEVHGTLRGLEDKFASKLEEAKKDHETRQAQFKDMHEAKADMLRLARKSSGMKERRLAEGAAVIAQAKSDIAAYNKQRDADYGLSASVKDVCETLAEAAAARLKQRQDTVIAISEEKAKQAKAAATKAASKVMLLRRSAAVTNRTSTYCQALHSLGAAFKGDCDAAKERAEDAKRAADETLAGARKAAKDLFALMDKSKPVQAEISKVLNSVVMNSHLATSRGKMESSIKSKVSALGDKADADLKATPALFDKVRAKAKTGSLADQKVVTSLMGGAAAAGQAVVNANKCK